MSNTRRRGPYPLTNRLSEFFKENPGEELTLEQIAAKFDVHRDTARNAVGYLKKSGFLCRTIIYRKHEG